MKYELPTTNGKTIKLNVAQIEITKNSLIKPSGYFVDIKLVGTLPGCRKSEPLTFSFFGGPEALSLTTLFNHRKFHNVKYSEMEKMLRTIPVVSPSYLSVVPITPEIEKYAREDRIAMYGTCKWK